eukprot:SAG11_NODE_36973_length_259_cov_0.637500_1_plen_33_part_01
MQVQHTVQPTPDYGGEGARGIFVSVPIRKGELV